MERWRLMEEFENVAKNEPLEPGDTISHGGAKALSMAGLILRVPDGQWILSTDGRTMMERWVARLPEVV